MNKQEEIKRLLSETKRSITNIENNITENWTDKYPGLTEKMNEVVADFEIAMWNNFPNAESAPNGHQIHIRMDELVRKLNNFVISAYKYEMECNDSQSVLSSSNNR